MMCQELKEISIKKLSIEENSCKHLIKAKNYKFQLNCLQKYFANE
jgi:hypothetical protein